RSGGVDAGLANGALGNGGEQLIEPCTVTAIDPDDREVRLRFDVELAFERAGSGLPGRLARGQTRWIRLGDGALDRCGYPVVPRSEDCVGDCGAHEIDLR